MEKKIKNSDDEVVEAVKSSVSMAEAARKLGLNYKTLRLHAKRLGIFCTNQSGKGTKKDMSVRQFPLCDIFNGLYPQYKTWRLSKRLVEDGFKKWQCEECGIKDWNGKKISFELDHINGVSTDHRLENLRMLCPNCHSQTPTWRGRNKK